MPKLLQYKYDAVIADYKSGLTQLEVAKKNNMDRTAIGNILRRAGVEIREYTGTRSDALRKWKWNYTFFDTKNDAIVAYWAGFLFADGSLGNTGKDSYSLTVAINSKDEKYLNMFCDDIQADRASIYRYMNNAGNEMVMLRLNHPGLADSLLSWGIVVRKTYVYSHPDISTDMLPHFLRGWVDGDGYVYRNGNGARVSVSGNHEALLFFRDSLVLLGYEGNCSVTKGEEKVVASKLYIGGIHQVDKICKILQVDTCGEHRFERKWVGSRYDSTQTTVTHICEVCGASFEVSEWRHNNEPENGRFCSKECFDIFQRGKTRIVEDGVEKKLCSHCNTYKSEEDWSANSAYCRSCWNERARNYRNSRKGN